MRFYFVGLIFLMLTGWGCASSTDETRPIMPGQNMVMSNTTSTFDNTAKLATVGDVMFTQEIYHPGDQSLSFKVFGSNGKYYTPDDLQIVHEMPMHIILVRRDMQDFRHVHPTYDRGYWTVKTTIQDPGDYYAYLDLTSKQDGRQVWRLPFRVTGNWKEMPTVPMKDLKVVKQGVEADLFLTQFFTTGDEVRVRFSLKENNAAYGKLKPYLGAYGHLVIMRPGHPERYLHVHPLTTDPPKNGTVEFTTTFPETGIYTLFAEFNLDGQVIVYPFTLEVGPNGLITTGGMMDLH